MDSGKERHRAGGPGRCCLTRLAWVVLACSLCACLRPPVVADGERLAPFESDAELAAFAQEVVQARTKVHGFGLLPRAPEDAHGELNDEASIEGILEIERPAAHMGHGPWWFRRIDVQVHHAREVVVRRGRHLVLLHRGRLISVDVDGGRAGTSHALKLAAASRGGMRYDQLLIEGDALSVVGRSAQTGIIEVVEVDIDAGGMLTQSGRWQLRSSPDFAASRSFAAVAVRGGLAFYAPVPVTRQRIAGELIATRRPGGDWKSLLPAPAIHRPLQRTLFPILHTAVRCRRGGTCTARAVIAPGSRSAYVSDAAAYVWAEANPYEDVDGLEASQRGSVLYRLPLDAGEASAIRVGGHPADGLTFRERNGWLSILIDQGDDDAPQYGADGDGIALLSLAVNSFGPRVGKTTSSAYRALPDAPYSGAHFYARFIGDRIVYGRGTGGYAEGEAPVALVAPISRPSAVSRVPLGHGVDHIVPLGTGALIVGYAKGRLAASTLSLRAPAKVASHIAGPEVEAGELMARDELLRIDGDDRFLGLSLRHPRGTGDIDLMDGAAGVELYALQRSTAKRVGVVLARPDERDDGCVVSCNDLFDHSQVVVVGARTFVWLGYELIEVALTDGKLSELARLDFFPSSP